VLGPVEFVAYTEDTVDIADKHQVRSHFYAEDSQMYDSCRPQDVSGVRDRLSVRATDRCVELVRFLPSSTQSDQDGDGLVRYAKEPG